MNKEFNEMEGLPPMIKQELQEDPHQPVVMKEPKMKEGKKKYVPTKSYQTEQKQKQKQSIVLRMLVFMRLLMCNCRYSFVVSRNRRASFKTLTYFPLEKMYNDKGELLFDSETVVMSNRNMKLKHCQKVVAEKMIVELENHGYVFGKIQTRKAKLVQEGNQPVTLTKITSVENPSCNVKVPMSKMETTIGMDGYDACFQTFDQNKHVEKLVIGNKDCIEQIFTVLIEKRVIEEGKSLYVCEGYDEMLEQVYWRQWTMSLNITNPTPVGTDQMVQQPNQSITTFDESEFSSIQLINQFNQMNALQQQMMTPITTLSPSNSSWENLIPQQQQQYQMIPNQQQQSLEDFSNTSDMNILSMYQDTFINNYQ